MHTEPTIDRPVLIVGAGLSGLTCALRLEQEGIPYKVFEKGDRVGGRVRTDVVDGFQLDLGFQVFLTAYPEAERWLDYDRLGLGSFLPGSLVRWNGRFHMFSDPWRHPGAAVRSLLSPVGTLSDKLKMAGLRKRLGSAPYESLLTGPDGSTVEWLRSEGFSEAVIDRFFRPFLGGIFLDPELQTSQRMFAFVFGMFARGMAALPAEGMGAIPAQLAESLDVARIHLGSEVVAVEDGRVRCSTGEVVDGAAVVLAGPSVASLDPEISPVATVATSCLYFAADEAPYRDAMLVLNGEGSGLVNNVAVLTNAAPTYSSDGRALVSVTVLKPGTDGDVVDTVRAQLTGWWPAATGWEHLRTVEVPDALPRQWSGHLEPMERPVRLRGGRYQCGDHVDNASIQGAMVSGRRAAEAVIQDRTLAT